MELKWLEDFISLANSRNFSKSAEQRNITQPAFSRRIQALENWLGATLVDRSTYPTKLTPAGNAFRETADKVLTLVHDARDEIREREGPGRATISFTALHTITLTFFPRWISEIASLLGPVRTFMNPGNFHDCIGGLIDGRYDLLLCFSHDSVPVPLDPQVYPSIKLAQDRFLPVSATDGRKRPLFRLNSPLTKLALDTSGLV